MLSGLLWWMKGERAYMGLVNYMYPHITYPRLSCLIDASMLGNTVITFASFTYLADSHLEYRLLHFLSLAWTGMIRILELRNRHIDFRFPGQFTPNFASHLFSHFSFHCWLLSPLCSLCCGSAIPVATGLKAGKWVFKTNYFGMHWIDQKYAFGLEI